MRMILWTFSIVVSAAVAGCAPPAPPVPPPQSPKSLLPAPQANGCQPGDKQSFVTAKVRALDPTAQFKTNFGGDDPLYTGPIPMGSATVDENKLLSDAFELAPSWLQSALCNQINFVFVDPNQYGGNSEFGWAFWESSATGHTQNAGNNSPALYIGISKAALDDPNLSLSMSETNILALLNSGPSGSPPGPTVTATIAGGTDSAAWAVLAIEAHEMGHLFWHSICDLARNQTDQGECKSFHDFGWKNLGGSWRLRIFGEPIPGAEHHSVGSVADDSIKDMRADSPQFPVLRRLYQGRGGDKNVRWADLFAAIAPDEDVAETYKLIALTDDADPTRPRVSALKIDYGNGVWTADVVANLSKSKLCKKAQFIRQALQQPSTACKP